MMFKGLVGQVLAMAEIALSALGKSNYYFVLYEVVINGNQWKCIRITPTLLSTLKLKHFRFYNEVLN